MSTITTKPRLTPRQKQLKQEHAILLYNTAIRITSSDCGVPTNAITTFDLWMFPKGKWLAEYGWFSPLINGKEGRENLLAIHLTYLLAAELAADPSQLPDNTPL